MPPVILLTFSYRVSLSVLAPCAFMHDLQAELICSTSLVAVKMLDHISKKQQFLEVLVEPYAQTCWFTLKSKKDTEHSRLRS